MQSRLLPDELRAQFPRLYSQSSNRDSARYAGRFEGLYGLYGQHARARA